MMDSGSGLIQERARGSHRQDALLARGPGLRARSMPTDGKPRGIGAIASTMRNIVRDTVYVTFDALRGRYDC